MEIDLVQGSGDTAYSRQVLEMIHVPGEVRCDGTEVTLSCELAGSTWHKEEV